jgi:heat shock protein HslJ
MPMPATPKSAVCGSCLALLLAACVAPPVASTVGSTVLAQTGPAAGGAAPAREGAVRWTVAPALVDCVGVGPTRCLRYRDAPDGPWKLHHGAIEGFEFRRGFEADLLVRFVPVPNPPADAPARRVVLVQEIERRPVELPPELPAMLADTSWEVASMPGAASLVGMRGPLSVSFERGGRASGHSGVNRFGASVRVEGDRLSFGQAIATRMAGPPEAMALEADFLGRLQRVAGWRIDGERLELLDDRGVGLMTLRRMAPGSRP